MVKLYFRFCPDQESCCNFLSYWDESSLDENPIFKNPHFMLRHEKTSINKTGPLSAFFYYVLIPHLTPCLLGRMIANSSCVCWDLLCINIACKCDQSIRNLILMVWYGQSARAVSLETVIAESISIWETVLQILFQATIYGKTRFVTHTWECNKVWSWGLEQ